MDFQPPQHQAGSAASGSRYIRDYVSQVLGISKDVDSTCSVEMLSQYLIDPFYSKKKWFSYVEMGCPVRWFLPFVTCLGITERHLTPSLLSPIRYLCTLERSLKLSFKAKQSQLSQALTVCQILQSSLFCLVLCWTLSKRPSLLYCRAQSWAQSIR